MLVTPLLMSPILYFWEISGFHRAQKAAVSSRRATNLDTHLPRLATHLSRLATHLPLLATQLPPLATHLPKKRNRSFVSSAVRKYYAYYAEKHNFFVENLFFSYWRHAIKESPCTLTLKTSYIYVYCKYALITPPNEDKVKRKNDTYFLAGKITVREKPNF